jgi:replicative DNA helicase
MTHDPPPAEIAIIGAVLLRPDTYHDVGTIPVEAFRHHFTRLVWRGIGELWQDGTTPDIIAIEDWSRSNGPEPIDIFRLFKYQDHAGLAIEAIAAAEQLRNDHLDYQVRLHCEALKKSPLRAAELLAEAQEVFAGISAPTGNGEPVRLTQAVKEVLEDADRKQKGEHLSLELGVPAMDRLGLLPPGCIMTIAGRPGMGKSAFLLWLMSCWVAQGERILVFSTETTRTQLAKRWIAADQRMNSMHIATGADSRETWQKMTAGAARLHPHPVWIDDNANRPGPIVSAIRRMHAREGIKIVAIDHIQKCIDNVEPRLETDRLLSAVHDTCKPLGIGLVLCSQFSRDVERRPSRVPQQSDLKESGAIEADSHSILFPFRSWHYRRHVEEYNDPKLQNRMTLIVEKNRDGATPEIPFAWDDDRGQVLGLEREEV